MFSNVVGVLFNDLGSTAPRDHDHRIRTCTQASNGSFYGEGMHPDADVASKAKYFNAIFDDGGIDFCTSDILPPRLCQRS